ncbi:TPA: hypothetical protein ACPJZV_004678 [Vibrio diabolicus]
MFSKLIRFFSAPRKTETIEVRDIQPKPSNGDTEVRKHSNSARDLLKQATQLKKEKEYDEACEKLKAAYSADGAEDLMVKDRLRLGMYLQLAGKSDEGWQYLNELNAQFVDVFSQLEISNQMRVFLQKEKQFSKAILFSIWSIAKGIECSRFNIQSSISMTDQMAKIRSEYDMPLDDSEKKTFGKTPKGNPITDSAYPMFLSRLNESTSELGIYTQIERDMKKAKLSDLAKPLSQDLAIYFTTHQAYKLDEIRDLVNHRINVV